MAAVDDLASSIEGAADGTDATWASDMAAAIETFIAAYIAELIADGTLAEPE